MAKLISAELQKAWDRFASNANWSGLHSLDEDRFYQVLVLAHREGHELTDGLIDRLLNGKALSDSMYDRLVRSAETASGVLDVVFNKGTRA